MDADADDKPNDISSPEKHSSEFLPESCDVSSSLPISPASSPLEQTDPHLKKSPTYEENTYPNSKDTMDRRKSVSWKAFNLKRQLSKVNLKIGISVSADSEAIKQGPSSTFNSEDNERDANSSPEDANVPSPKEDETEVNCKENELNTNTNAYETNSLLRNTIYEHACEYDTKYQIASVNDDNSTFCKNFSDIQTKKNLKFVQEGNEAQEMRPKDLPLFTSETETENIPIKPARQRQKEKRDQRLLSVPNIQYQSKDLHAGSNKSDSSPSFTNIASNRINKLDGSFSRSRSSSMSSIDMSSSESVTSLALIETFTRKNDASIYLPTLWIGTSFGSILTMFITMPEKESRKTQPILVTINGGPMIRLKGSIKSMSFLDAFGSVIPYPYELWKDDSKEGKRDRTPTKSSSKTSPTFSPVTATSSNSPSGNITSGTSGSTGASVDTFNDKQFVVVVSEKQARVLDITNQCCINKIQIADMDFVVKANTVTMKDGSCLAAYLSNGHLIVYSLPSLRVLLDTEFLPLMDLSFQTKCKQGIVDPMLSIWGQQIIVNEDTNHQFLPEMMAELFVPHLMPEQPKEGFLKGLFGGGTKNLDREELFGEQSGKANRSVAKHIPGANIDQLGQRASTAASEISRAHQLALERGEKLNMLEEKAERMANQAQDFSGSAHQLMLKYKDKKWYQL